MNPPPPPPAAPGQAPAPAPPGAPPGAATPRLAVFREISDPFSSFTLTRPFSPGPTIVTVEPLSSGRPDRPCTVTLEPGPTCIVPATEVGGAPWTPTRREDPQARPR